MVIKLNHANLGSLKLGNTIPISGYIKFPILVVLLKLTTSSAAIECHSLQKYHESNFGHFMVRSDNSLSKKWPKVPFLPEIL